MTKSALFTLAGLIAAAFGVASYSSMGLVIQFLLGKLTYSTSNGAALFMLAMCSIAVVILTLNPKPNRYSNSAITALPFILFSGFLLNGLATAYYLLHFDLPFGAYFLHWRAGFNSYTSPFHSHIGKVAIDFMARLLTLPTTSTSYDMGGVFRSVINDSFAAILSLCFVMGCVATISALPSVKLRYAGHSGLLILYLCSATAALKNILDGGFLAQPAPVVFVVCVFLTLAQNTQHLCYLLNKYRWPGLMVILMAFLPQIIGSDAGSMPNLTELLVALALVGFVLVISLKQPLGIAGLLTGLYLISTISIDARFSLWPLLQPLAQDSKIVRVDSAAMQPVTVNVSASQLYRQLGDSAFKTHWLLIDNQKNGARELLYFIKPLDLKGRQGEFKLEAAFMDLQMRQLPQNPNWLALYARVRDDLPPARIDGFGDVFSRNNAYVYTHAIARMLTASGFNEFIMMPATSTNALPAEFLNPQF